MASGDIHTVPAVHGWKNEREDGATIRYYGAKFLAVSDGQAMAANEKVSHFVYDRCGSVLRRADYQTPTSRTRREALASLGS